MKKDTMHTMRDWKEAAWNTSKTVYWFVSNEDPDKVWGFDTYNDALQYAEIFDGHIEITRPDQQLDLFN